MRRVAGGKCLTPIDEGSRSCGSRRQSGLLPRSTSGVLPFGTRSIKVFLSATRVSNTGPYNDGYADNMSLVLYGPRLYLPLIVR